MGPAIRTQRLTTRLLCTGWPSSSSYLKVMKPKLASVAQASRAGKSSAAIARALRKRPKILLFDEATSALDEHTAEGFAYTINQLKGRVSILFAHACAAQGVEGRWGLAHWWRAGMKKLVCTVESTTCFLSPCKPHAACNSSRKMRRSTALVTGWAGFFADCARKVSFINV